MNKIEIKDFTLIGDWKEVDNLPSSAITNNQADKGSLSGIVLKGYEMKWGGANENGEVYEQGAFDRFINEYFVKRCLNMPVTVNHSERWEDEVGKVLYIERNTVGFYFVVYIPKTIESYYQIKTRLKEGILQGFSKEGYATDYSYQEDGTMVVREMMVTKVSIVSTPANGIKFEKMEEAGVKDALTFKVADEVEAENVPRGTIDLFDDLFS